MKVQNPNMCKSYDDLESYKSDSYNDLKRWIGIFNNTFFDYSTEKYFYEMEKQLKIQDDSTLEKMASIVSEYRNTYKDIRMGINWYEFKFSHQPRILKQFYHDVYTKIERLKRIKAYMTKRVRSMGSNKIENKNSKNFLVYIKVQLKILNVMITDKYNTRKINNNITSIYDTV